MSPAWISAADARRYFGVDPKLLKVWVHRGNIKRSSRGYEFWSIAKYLGWFSEDDDTPSAAAS